MINPLLLGPVTGPKRPLKPYLPDEAQKISDGIGHGRLVIHAHADDAGTVVTIGTYRDSGSSVYLHGNNHVRQVADTFDSPAQALASFERLHGDTMRPGPALATPAEHEAAAARTPIGTQAAGPQPPAVETETVPFLRRRRWQPRRRP
ncbi:hypothetical protein H0H10_26560 [Streptomyces sp. TRM S81-3]|uniref:Uncharacterized protein n=1 Tax=Streptomyces griseicoloratus TaxID=2752516 RepID=A0A926QU24_9ACTN|nr:hypothetical protein [Streptomyces griseicoloratus]